MQGITTKTKVADRENDMYDMLTTSVRVSLPSPDGVVFGPVSNNPTISYYDSSYAELNKVA